MCENPQTSGTFFQNDSETLEEPLTGHDSEKWKLDMNEEFSTFKRNET